MIKQLLFLSAVFLFSLGCEAGSKNSEGGINSGGGDTLKPSDVDVKSLSLLIPIVHKIAPYRLYNAEYTTWFFVDEENQFVDGLSVDQGAMSLLASGVSAFSAEPSIYEVVEKAELMVLEDAPCKDKEGRDRDGSVAHLEPYKICLSPFNMSRKLDADNKYKKLLGLMMKEYVRHLGFGDEEALHFQKFISEDQVATLSDFRLAADQFSQFTQDLRSFLQLLDSVLTKEVVDREVASQLLEQQYGMGLNFLSPNTIYSFFSPEEYTAFTSMLSQLYSLGQFSLGEELYQFGDNRESTVGKMRFAGIDEEYRSHPKSKMATRFLTDNTPIYKIEKGNVDQLKEHYLKIKDNVNEKMMLLEETHNKVQVLRDEVHDYLNR